MKRVKVLKNGIVTNQAEEIDPDAWVAKQVSENSWGKPERWVREGDEDISGALETRTIDLGEGMTATEHKLPAQYEIVIEDITAEVAANEADKAKKITDLAALKAFKKSDITNLTDAVNVIEKLVKVLIG